MEQLSIVKRDVKGIKEEIEKKKQETSEPIQIPNRIRSAVKDAFINGQQISLSWNCSKGFMDEENLEMTDFIRKSIQGIAPDEKCCNKEIFHISKGGSKQTEKEQDGEP
uniref:Uncharacterized protein LOC111103079 isoform X2 n=1 Tax=Crassostrea virginica TaxID=6565 RepID=A0A8B8AKW7_CRAVI|nr:uncharacterized protein LOC111103079 isoform X2 [Crassostrea virginica]